MRVGVLLGLLAGCSLASCAGVAPGWRGGELGVEVPGGWSGTDEGRAGVDGRWIESFGDKRLVALVDEAMANNPDLKVSAERLRIAQGNIAIAASAMKPTLDLNLNGRRQKQNFIGFPDFGGEGGGDPGGGAPGGGAAGGGGAPAEEVLSVTSESFGVSLDVNWELDVWGRIRAGQSAAIGQFQAAQADQWAAETSLAAQVAKAYFGLAEAREQLALAEATVGAYRETEAAIRERFELGQNDGRSVSAELRLAMSDVAAGRADVEARREARDVAVRQLEVLLGRYAQGVENGRATLPGVPKRAPAGLPSELLRRRPDVLAAERRFAAQGMRVKEGERAVYPQFRLTGSTGTSSEDLGDLLSSDFGVWNLAGNVVQPILTGGQLRAQIDVRRSEEREAMARLQGTVLKAFSEVETALAAERTLERREAALREAVKLAEEADRQAREDYAGGTGDFLTVTNAQVRVLQTKGGLLTVRRLRLDNRVNLHLALGGDFKVRAKR